MPGETYTYERFNKSSAKPFRLLSLQPGTGPHVEVILTESSLEGQVEYEALSYTWGSPDDEPQFVQCNGKALRVTKNCERALRNLGIEEPRILWVDAICIDQSLYEERNQQVMMMQEIYEKAVRVVVWLGESSRDLNIAMYAIQFFAHMLRTEENVQPEHDGCKRLMDREDVKTALTSLADLPWWRRVWVVQEIYAAPIAVIQCGRREVSWDDFVEFAVWVALKGVARFSEHIGIVSQRVALMMCLKGRKSTLPNALAAYENQMATDPRDKVFALNGLLHQSSRIRVDYSLPTEEVLILASKKCLEVTSSFDALRAWDFSQRDAHDNRTGSLPVLPSWVRDISIPRFPNMIEISPNFSASRSSKLLYSIEERALTIKCKILDKISLCGAQMRSGSPEAFVSAVRMWWIVVFSLKRYPTGEDLFDVFWQLLSLLSRGKPSVSNLKRDNTPPPQEPDDTIAPDLFRTWTAAIGFNKSPVEADAAVRRNEKLLLFQNVLNVPVGLGVCTTTKSFVGAVPPTALPGDVIAIPTGSTKPYVFREKRDGTFRVLGPCYIHGIMLGEYWSELVVGMRDSDLQTITIT